MEDWSTIPILDYQPGGGVPVGPISNPPVYSQAGTTQLVEGQAYIDVVFGSIQTDDEWVLVECIVVNEIDVDPLNIWPGIITDKTQAGFRLQLNGMPDSGNYYLHWAVSGVNIAPSPATTYSLTGPSSGGLSVASSVFTVAIAPSTTLAAPVIVTPDDGGGGGTFTPANVTLTTGSPSKTFTYTPASYGDKTISTTNGGPLSNPASIVFTCISSTYTLSGPSTGAVSVASTDFTAALPVGGAVLGTITVTPSDGGGGGTFTPTTVSLTTAAPSATFTYTPASSGTKTISVTNNGGLTDPGNLTYTVTVPLPTYSLSGPGSGLSGAASGNFTVTLATSPPISGTVTVTPNDGGDGGTFIPTSVGVTDASPTATFTYTPGSTGTKTISVTNSGGLTNPGSISYVSLFNPATITGLKMWVKADSLALSDGASVTTWPDSSANGYNLGSLASPPVFKTNIVNGHPVVRYNGTNQGLEGSVDIGVTQPDTIFVVASQTAFPSAGLFTAQQIVQFDVNGYLVIYAGAVVSDAIDHHGGFHVVTATFNSGTGTGYVDGTQTCTGSSGTNTVGNLQLGFFSGVYYPCDIAEVLIYNSVLSSTDRNNVVNYLKSKYGIS